MNILVQRKFSQQGAVLIFSLIILLIITLVGTAAMRLTTLEEKVAGNISNYDFAFQAAESALRAGERELRELPSKPPLHKKSDKPKIPWVWDNSDKALPWWKKNDEKYTSWWNLESYDLNWWKNNDNGNGGGKSHTYALKDILPGVITEPLYIIEYEGRVPHSLSDEWLGYENRSPIKHYYRITARAAGGSQEAEVLLQSVFAWYYNP